MSDERDRFLEEQLAIEVEISYLESAIRSANQAYEILVNEDFGLEKERRDLEKRRVLEAIDRLDCTTQHLKNLTTNRV